MKPKQQLVVIGNGMAGMRTIEELLSVSPDQYEITVFGTEPYGEYNRIMLSAILSGDKPVEDIIIKPRQWYVENKIKFHAGEKKAVARIERGYKKVIAIDGTTASYDRLLIATGSKAISPKVDGHNLDGVISFRHIMDVNKILDYSRTHKKVVVLGGSLLGLETAYGLALHGMEVTVVHSHQMLLNRQLDKTAATLLQNELEQRGIVFKMSAKLKALIGNENKHIIAAQFEDKSELACDLFITAIGIEPNITLAKEAGLYCERGIVVNDTLQTYDPSIYAVGECIQHRGATFELAAPLFEQAKVCASRLSKNGVAEYITLPTATKLKVAGIQLFSIGDFLGDDESESITFSNPALGIYKKLVLKTHRLIGAILYGDTTDSGWYQELLEQKMSVSTLKDKLIFGKDY